MGVTDELRPCPFCGGKARIKHLYYVDGDDPTHSKVECGTCHIGTTYYVYQHGDRNVIEVWNRRSDERY